MYKKGFCRKRTTYRWCDQNVVITNARINIVRLQTPSKDVAHKAWAEHFKVLGNLPVSWNLKNEQYEPKREETDRFLEEMNVYNM